jgi:hypothetical protein
MPAIVVMLRPRHAVDFKRWLRLLYRWRKQTESFKMATFTG